MSAIHTIYIIMILVFTLCTLRPLTEKEKFIAGLLGHTHAPKLEVVNMGPLNSRGVVAAEPIPKGSYVCEYRTYRV